MGHMKSTAINIACWTVLRGQLQLDGATVGECEIVMPVGHKDSTECVLCEHGVCDVRIEAPSPGRRGLVRHTRGGQA